MILAFLLNVLLVAGGEGGIFIVFLVAQIVFYSAAYLGKILEDRKVKVKLLFIPYYFRMMNYAVLAGLVRYFKGNQSVIWEKALRK